MGKLSLVKFGFGFVFVIFSVGLLILVSSGTFISAVTPQNSSNSSNSSIRCSSNTQCDDGDVITFDECVNPGLNISYCSHNEVNCLSDLECGFSGFLGTEYCTLDNVYKNFQDAKCINPGSLNSYCSVDVAPQLIQDCNDNNLDTIDSCVEHTQSTPTYCSHEIFSCTQVSQCGNIYSELSCEGNDVHNITHSPTCSQGICGEQINDVFVQYCQYGCNLGICQNQTIIDECTSNSECNDSNPYTEDLCAVNNSTGGNICSNPQIACLSNNDCLGTTSNNYCSVEEDVYKTVSNFSCLYPGTKNSYCHLASETDILVKECSNGCSNGVCKSSSGSGSGTSNRGGGGGRSNLFDDLPYIIAPNGEILGQEKPISQVIIIEEDQNDSLTTKRLPSSLNNSNSGLLWILLLFLFLLLLIILIIILSNITKK